ncbi:Hypothetical protein NGAL_HAMBI1145_56990 [Neorhizobium galegae bv. officinalis]|uniref:Uncharacterized protein n=1 Tax=Neorhizobium galegae bv. officinalis TaxID=323656 RepID=A0A0T7G186_NEOGA|nr:Hypothetical protein NGAL_HAMBI1145_56990 [Neorhizobium galegae bv. officinalis]CDZ53447.1 Hypothetical protein NGAL_HAMBI1189_49940 [Neorhizobium galegae bv. officinalis]
MIVNDHPNGKINICVTLKSRKSTRFRKNVAPIVEENL